MFAQFFFHYPIIPVSYKKKRKKKKNDYYYLHNPTLDSGIILFIVTVAFTATRTSCLDFIPGMTAGITKTLSAVTDHVVTTLLLFNHKSTRWTMSPMSVLDQLKHDSIGFRVVALCLILFASISYITIFKFRVWNHAPLVSFWSQCQQ